MKLTLSVGGVATVVCVHDREKRRVRDLSARPGIDKVQDCACCGNLFTTLDDTPMLCVACSGAAIFELQAPLPAPAGVI